MDENLHLEFRVSYIALPCLLLFVCSAVANLRLSYKPYILFAIGVLCFSKEFFTWFCWSSGLRYRVPIDLLLFVLGVSAIAPMGHGRCRLSHRFRTLLPCDFC
jgi:hypothetical protein